MPYMDSIEGMVHGGGMMSEDDMAALEAATGAEASRLFLEQMTMHHEGAIEMAQDDVDNGQTADAVALAQTIVATQTAEIAETQDLPAQLSLTPSVRPLRQGGLTPGTDTGSHEPSP